MADLTATSQITIRYSRRRRLDHAGLGIGATLSALAQTMLHAFSMAYVEPYRTPRRQSSNATEAEADGRDPEW